jgi:hypothetical protein
VNKLAKLTGIPATALITATADTDGVVGIVTGGAGTTGNAQITVDGQASCVFDNTTVAGDFVAISTTTAGDCHDAGATRSTTSQTIGRVLASSGSAGTYAVALGLNASASASGAPTGSGTTNSVARWTPNGNTLGIGTLYDTGTLVSVGTTSTASMLGVYGGASIGTSYVGTAAPTNGMIVQGNVGIGTTGPNEKLDVYGVVEAEDGSSDANGFSGFTWASGSGTPLISVGWPGSTTSTNFIKSAGGDNLSLAIGAANGGSASGAIYFNTNNSYAMAILKSGYVGIGTTSPSQLLTVNGNALVGVLGQITSTQDTLQVESYGASGSILGGIMVGGIIGNNVANTTYGGRFFADSGGNVTLSSIYDTATSALYFKMRTYGTPITAMTILGSGNVGIGTTSPAGTLDVEGGTAAASTNGTSINLVAQSAGTGNRTAPAPWAFGCRS